MSANEHHHRASHQVPRQLYNNPRHFTITGTFTERQVQEELKSAIVTRQYTRGQGDNTIYPPMLDFSPFEHLPRFKDTFDNLRYSIPTPIQAHAIPYILETDFNVHICAKPGSGKTLAYLLPILDYVLRVKELPRRTGLYQFNQSPSAVIITPTCLLTLEIVSLIKLLVQNKISVGYGLKSSSENREDEVIRREGCDIYVGTIGKVKRQFCRDHALLLKNKLRYVVLDGLINGNGVFKMINEIFTDVLSKQCRLVVVDSDIEDPDGLCNLLNNRYIRLGFETRFRRRQDPTHQLTIASVWDLSHIWQEVLIASDSEKLDHLLGYFAKRTLESRKTLIFVNTLDKAEDLQRLITQQCAAQERQDQWALVLEDEKHQMKDEFDRVRLFREDVCTCLIVVGDRITAGLNLPHVSAVINYDCPRTGDEYVRRIGRTGRALTPGGQAITYFNPCVDREFASDLVMVLEASGHYDEAEQICSYA